MKIILIFVIIIIFISCNSQDKNKKFELPVKYFNIEYLEKMDSINDFTKISKIFNYRGEYFYHNITVIRMYSDIINQFIYSNSTLEIMFTRAFVEKINNKYKPFILHCLIGARKYIFTAHCYYIFWTHSKTNLRESWGVNELTDTIYTNIDEEEIKKRFQLFKGKVVNGKIKNIIVNHRYAVDDFRFYDDIELIGFDRFYTVDIFKSKINK